MLHPLPRSLALIGLTAAVGCTPPESQDVGSLELVQGEGQEDVVEVVGAGGENPDQPDGGSGKVNVRLIHLSYDLYPVDLYVDADESPVVTGLAFGESTATAEMTASMHDLRLTQEGSPTALLEMTAFPLDTSPYVTLAVVGSNTAGSLTLFDEPDLNGPMPEGAFRLHVGHTAPGFAATRLNVARFEGSNPVPVQNDLGYLSREVPSFDMPTRAAVYGVDLNGDSNFEYVYDVPEQVEGTVVNMFFTDGPAGSLSVVLQAWDGSTSVIRPR